MHASISVRRDETPDKSVGATIDLYFKGENPLYIIRVNNPDTGRLVVGTGSVPEVAIRRALQQISQEA